jgi:hypothetical protein
LSSQCACSRCTRGGGPKRSVRRTAAMWEAKRPCATEHQAVRAASERRGQHDPPLLFNDDNGMATAVVLKRGGAIRALGSLWRVAPRCTRGTRGTTPRCRHHWRLERCLWDARRAHRFRQKGEIGLGHPAAGVWVDEGSQERRIGRWIHQERVPALRGTTNAKTPKQRIYPMRSAMPHTGRFYIQLKK